LILKSKSGQVLAFDFEKLILKSNSGQVFWPITLIFLRGFHWTYLRPPETAEIDTWFISGYFDLVPERGITSRNRRMD
jgi:hypothetical protein